jgi:hypothetical protein
MFKKQDEFLHILVNKTWHKLLGFSDEQTRKKS